MSCTNCSIKLDTNYSIQLCQACYNNDTVALSSNAIYCYFHLGWQDLQRGNVPCIKTKHGEKWLFTDILELARIVTEKKTDASPMKQAYYKQKERIDKIQQLKEMLSTTKNNIKQSIILLLPKYNIN